MDPDLTLQQLPLYCSAKIQNINAIEHLFFLIFWLTMMYRYPYEYFVLLGVRIRGNPKKYAYIVFHSSERIPGQWVLKWIKYGGKIFLVFDTQFSSFS